MKFVYKLKMFAENKFTKYGIKYPLEIAITFTNEFSHPYYFVYILVTSVHILLEKWRVFTVQTIFT